MPASGNRQLYAPQSRPNRGLREALDPDAYDPTPDLDDLAPYARLAAGKNFEADDDFCLLLRPRRVW